MKSKVKKALSRVVTNYLIPAAQWFEEHPNFDKVLYSGVMLLGTIWKIIEHILCH